MLYNMSAVLASVALGFDIRISNSTAIHPRAHAVSEVEGDEDEEATPPVRRSQDAFVGQRRDAYFAAVRDSFIEPDPNYTDRDFQVTSPSGVQHNTYHGHQTRYRPSVNFDIPIRFTDSSEGYYTADSHTTPSSDNRTTPSADSRTTPSMSGTSFSGGSPSPRKSSAEIEQDLALISLSPSQDKAFVEYQRQLSDTSSVFETPKTTPKTTPQRHSVKFEEGAHHSPSPYSHRRSPSESSNSHEHGPRGQEHMSRYDRDHNPSKTQIPNAIRPPPPRRQSSHERTAQGSAERPVTLDIIPRPRPHASILKKTSPAHMANRSPARGGVTPTPSDSISAGGDDASFVSARSGTSPGSTPPHIEHQRTLLDIDMEGQSLDSTKPLPAKQAPRPPTITELENEFLP